MRITLFLLFIALTHLTLAQDKVDKKILKYFVKGDTAKAIAYLNKHIQKKPESAELYLKRARIKIQRGDLDPAMVDLNSFCSINKSCGEASYLKGLIRYRQKDYNGAISHLSDYSRVFDKDANGWLYLGLSHLQLKNFQLAINAFERTLQINAKQYQAAYNAGLCAYNNEDFELAVRYFTMAIDIKPNDISPQIGLALAQTAMAKYTESNQTLNIALALDAQNAPVLYNMGVNFYNLDQLNKACEQWKKAAALSNLAAESALERYCEGK
ncbi:MAG: tetratricopeptide repeat protein [Flavobacteriales bacterium]